MAKKNSSATPADLQGITVTQSNRVTNAHYNYSLIQERVFTWIMYHLQTYIREVMNGKGVHQLDMFSQQSKTHLIDIPLSRIGRPSQYNEIREICEGMVSIPIVMLNEERKTRNVAGLISSVQTKFQDKERFNTVRIEMREDVIKLIINVDRKTTEQGGKLITRPSEYTQYQLHVAMAAKNKYTSKLYKLLSSWKNKGGFRITLDQLRDFLQIKPGKYKNFNDLKRHVLMPAQKELKEIADLWFNCADTNFAVLDGKKVTGINFKIIEPMSAEILSKKIDHVFWALKNTFGCAQSHCERIRPLLHQDTDWDMVRECLDKCYRHMQDNEIKYPPAYVVKALINDLPPER